MIKLIVFDLWATLAKRDGIDFHFALKIVEEFKLDKLEADVNDIFRNTVKTRRWETEFDAYIEFARNVGIEPTKENTFKIMKLRKIAESNVMVYDFVYPLFKALKKNNYILSIITNSSIFEKELLEKNTRILDYIDYPLFSYEIGAVKPNPMIYLELQRQTMILADEIVMIGDNFINDVLTPKQLNWNAIHFDGDYNRLKKDLEALGINLK
ncbi:HAD family hydrolase [archaeon]|jgi:HAD superfamily hydrolase (TIGR01549 family)|nr:HAD family hydrolase [archaeon]MCK9439476.1 HAD family hydrolase [Patescibacteria group bacterium]MDD2478090.1 HAD family hydrolase [Candidatus ainarchaeum sp.]MDD3085009.1 HAD family hydrolase [Candidatus ainarchaeum sp.]